MTNTKIVDNYLCDNLDVNCMPTKFYYILNINFSIYVN